MNTRANAVLGESDTFVSTRNRGPLRCKRCIQFGGEMSDVCEGRKAESSQGQCEFFDYAGNDVKSLLDANVTEKHGNPKPGFDRKNWVELTHRGHVSDYHGALRQYGAFIPITFGESREEINESIESVLSSNGFDESTESDDEIASENESLRRAFSHYSHCRRAEKTSGRKRRFPTQQQDSQKAVDLFSAAPVLFDRQARTRRVSDCSDKQCRICSIDQGLSATLERSVLEPQFKEIEEDPMDLGYDGKANKKARPSRTRELALQKKASLFMLSDLRYKMSFISRYNKPGEIKSMNQDKSSLPKAQSSDSEVATIHLGQVDNAAPSSQESKDHFLTMEDKSSLDLATLSYGGLFEDYRFLQSKTKSIMGPLGPHPTSSDLRENLRATLDNCDVARPDEQDLQEHRSYLRATRTYTGKADQERIEKLRHGEERENLLMELEHKNRGRKPTLAELELSEFEVRPACFGVQQVESACSRKEQCCICLPQAQVLMTEVNSDKIFHPAYRRVHSSYFDDKEQYDVIAGRRNRTMEKMHRKSLGIEKICSLEHRVAFVDRYNSSLLNSLLKRKR